MSKLTKIYLELERRVGLIRASHSDASRDKAIKEDAYLDVMDLLWWEMTTKDRETLEARSLEEKDTLSVSQPSLQK